MNHSEPMAGHPGAAPRFTQFIDADAQVRAPLPEFARQAATLRELYQGMVEARSFDKKASALQRSGQLPAYAANLGQEAIGAAIAYVLQAGDTFVSAYGDNATLLHGAQMLDVLRRWRQPAVNKTAPLDRAILRAAELGRSPAARVVLALLGDEATEADLLQTLASAEAAALPLVLVWPTHRQSLPQADEDARLTPAGLPPQLARERVDGNDVIAMLAVLERKLERARRRNGPALIEAITCRLHDERSGDGADRSRAEAELRAAWERCPIKRLRRHLESQSLWTIDDEEAALLAAGERVAAAARAFLADRPRA